MKLRQKNLNFIRIKSHKYKKDFQEQNLLNNEKMLEFQKYEKKAGNLQEQIHTDMRKKSMPHKNKVVYLLEK